MDGHLTANQHISAATSAEASGMLIAFLPLGIESMFNRSKPLLAVSLLLCASAWSATKPSTAEDKAAVVTVNQQAVGQDAFAFMLNEQLVRGAADGQQLRQMVRNELIVQTVLSQQAVAQKLDQSTQGRALLETSKRTALAQLWQQDWLQKNPVSKQALEEEYKNLVSRLGPDEFQVRHILLRDETAARLVLEKIKVGASLATLAPEYSADEFSKNKGGLLDWSSPALMVPGLGDAIKDQAAPKKFEAPVQSQSGWHVVHIEAKRPIVAPTFEALQPQLVRVVTQRELARAIQALVNQAKVD